MDAAKNDRPTVRFVSVSPHLGSALHYLLLPRKISYSSVFSKLQCEKSIVNTKSTKFGVYQLSVWSHRWCFYKIVKIALQSFRFYFPFQILKVLQNIFFLKKNIKSQANKHKKAEEKFGFSWNQVSIFFSSSWIRRNDEKPKKRKLYSIWREEKKIQINLIRKNKLKSPNRIFSCFDFLLPLRLCVYFFSV